MGLRPRTDLQSTPCMSLLVEPLPSAGTYGEWIGALPQALALCCHHTAIPALARPVCSAHGRYSLPASSPIPAAWLSVPCPQESPAGLHGDPIHLSASSSTGWDAWAVVPGPAVEKLAVGAGRNHCLRGCQEAESGCCTTPTLPHAWGEAGPAAHSTSQAAPHA